MTNGPLEVTMVVSCEFGPVLNLEGVSQVDYVKNNNISPSGREVNTRVHVRHMFRAQLQSPWNRL